MATPRWRTVSSSSLLKGLLASVTVGVLASACTTPSQNTTQQNAPNEPLALSSESVQTEPAQVNDNKAEIVSDRPNATKDSLNPVPPDGLESLDEPGLSYFQQMGPLEYATRLGGIPETEAWRVRLRLYPNEITDEQPEQTYRVKLDHYNLSPALYEDLVSVYGDNTDPGLAEDVPHRNIELAFLPVMGIAADWLSELTQVSQSPMTENPDCGVDLGCAQLRTAPEIDDSAANDALLEASPWEAEVEPLYALVRSLAAQAGWRQDNGSVNTWIYPEQPEGISGDRPWVEIVVDNYIGNGSGYSAEWIQLVADDSIRKQVHRIVYDGRSTAQADTQYVCARGDAAGELRSLCP